MKYIHSQLRSLFILTVFLVGTSLLIYAQGNAGERVSGIDRAHYPLASSISRMSGRSPQSLARLVSKVKPPGSSQAKGWRGIVPLKSSRKHVEEVIGQPISTGGSSYQTTSESVFVHYSDGTQARSTRALPNNESPKSHQRFDDVEIYFTFDPTNPTRIRRENSVSLVVRQGGSEVVLFDRDRSAVVATYKGLISKAHSRRWAQRVRAAIKEANSLKEDETVVRESDLFSLSIIENGKVEATGGKVEDMPEDVRRLVTDLNLAWRSFKESPRAAAYLKAEFIEKKPFARLQQKREVNLGSIDDFPVDLRQMIRKAIDHPGFHALNQARYDQLRTQGLLIVSEGSAYVLKLFPSQGNPGRQ